ncbi:MAG TPA: molybdate ABC transporter substrate-binding protein [Thermomicrobiales bacterium]|nr:molybdate ABC transporter substrate-binding protein [Thermomicrobiales bacterium]
MNSDQQNDKGEQMGHLRVRTACVCCLAFALLLAAQVVGGSVAPAGAQATTWSCSPATPSAADSAATPASLAPATPIAFPEGGGNLTVFAAASLTDAFNTMAHDLEAAHPGLKITINFAGSQQLVTQLTEGAPADVFASANNSQMQAAVDGGVIDGTPETFVKNQLAIIVPKDNPGGVQNPADLAKKGLKLDLAAPAVPVGKYARVSICQMGADTATYGEGFVQNVAANVVSEENNVKAVVTKIQLGEADAGIVYTTDVTKEVANDVTVIEIPPAVNVIATYPVAAVKGGNTQLAQAFISYLLGPDGQATLKQYGFQPVR